MVKKISNYHRILIALYATLLVFVLTLFFVFIPKGFITICVTVLIFTILVSVYITKLVVRIERQHRRDAAEKNLDELRFKKLLELGAMGEASIDTLAEFALAQACELTRSEFGCLGFSNEDQAEPTIYLWPKQSENQGKTCEGELTCNMKDTGLWAEIEKSGRVLVINDYENYRFRSKQEFFRGNVKINRVLSAPAFDGDTIVAWISVGNKREDYNDSDIRQLHLMMDGMWKILQGKKAQIQLKLSEERYRLLADNATDTIWIMQYPDLKMRYISPSIQTLLGYTPGAFLELELNDYLTENSLKRVPVIIAEELGEISGDDIESKGLKGAELELIKKDGSTIWIEISAGFLRNDQGEPDAILGISRDISDRKRADEERKKLHQHLDQARKMEAIGILAGGIAHDFNNILSGQMGFTDLAMHEAKDNETLKRYLNQVTSASLRARDLVRQILTFSRESEVEKQPITINPVIKESLKFIRASLPAGIEIHRDLRVEQGRVFGDATQIYQVLMELFTNAAHAMKDHGGVLDIVLDRVQLENAQTGFLGKIFAGGFIELVISDTGCGIHKKYLDRIFEPFFTTKARGEGTGMGLATVYGIVKEMGGGISVYSEVGVGTTFRLLLPEYDHAEPVQIDINTELKKGQGNILVVDDEEAIAESSCDILNILGYSTVMETDSLKAVEHVKNNPEHYDLVLTDMTMPRLDGFGLAKQIKKINPDISIVLATGFSHSQTKEKCRDAGIEDMVMKPMTAGELSSVVEKAINKDH